MDATLKEPSTREQALAIRAFQNQQRAERAESRVRTLESQLSQSGTLDETALDLPEGGRDDA